MHSMTGFGRGEHPSDTGTIVVEIKTVNTRFMDIRTRAPSELSELEVRSQQLIKTRVARGYCTINITLEQNSHSNTVLNQDFVDTSIPLLQDIADRHGLSTASLLPLLSTAPDLFLPCQKLNRDALMHAGENACNQAIEALLKMRQAEGTTMAVDIKSHIQRIRSIVSTIDQQRQRMNDTILSRYKNRILTLIEGIGDTTDNYRIEMEAAILAEKCDINEEVTRLFSHLQQFETLFQTDGPIGRKMEFLIQEMGRENNTIGSKSHDLEITRQVVDMKCELEKIKEQVQNVE